MAWHAFILHSRDYERYCMERFGKVIHHQPTGAPDPDAYRRAYEQRAAVGGPADSSVWVAPVAVGGAVAGSEVAEAAGAANVGGTVQDTGPGDGGGGGFFSNLFGGGSSDSGGGSGDSGASGGGDSGGGLELRRRRGGCGGGGG